jgi:hypothetical protein
MICSSVNRLAFMSIPQWVMDSSHFWRRFRGSGQPAEIPLEAMERGISLV